MQRSESVASAQAAEAVKGANSTPTTPEITEGSRHPIYSNAPV